MKDNMTRLQIQQFNSVPPSLLQVSQGEWQWIWNIEINQLERMHVSGEIHSAVLDCLLRKHVGIPESIFYLKALECFHISFLQDNRLRIVFTS